MRVIKDTVGLYTPTPRSSCFTTNKQSLKSLRAARRAGRSASLRLYAAAETKEGNIHPPTNKCASHFGDYVEKSKAVKVPAHLDPHVLSCRSFARTQSQGLPSEMVNLTSRLFSSYDDPLN